MLELLEKISAVRMLYNHLKDYVSEEDFWYLTNEQYAKMPPERQSETWFMINPSKLKKVTAAEVWIANEREKGSILSAITFIRKITSDLPETSSFLERLLYAKKNLQPIFFERED